MGQKVCEVDQVLVGEVCQLLRHCSTVAQPDAALVLPHRLEQIVFALIGQPRHLLSTGEVGVVTDATRMTQGQPPASIEPLGVRRLLGS